MEFTPLVTKRPPNRPAPRPSSRPPTTATRVNSDRQNARIEHDEALRRVMTAVLNDDMQLFKQFTDNEGFQRWLTDTVFGLTYAQPQAEDQATVRD